MSNMTWKLLAIAALVGLCVVEITPYDKKLKPGIDLAGGTSLIYQIDTTGLEEFEKRDIGRTMIHILRQRIDPGSKMNLVWRVQGRDRIEIQMPLATKVSQEKHALYQAAREELGKNNVDMRLVRRAMLKPAEMSLADYRVKRDNVFANVGGGGDNQEQLEELTLADDAYRQAQEQLGLAQDASDELKVKLEQATVSIDSVEAIYAAQAELDKPNRVLRITQLAGDDKAKQELIEQYLDNREKVGLGRNLISSKGGLRELRDNAVLAVSHANIDLDRLEKYISSRSAIKRNNELERLKASHPESIEQIDSLTASFDEYSKIAGRLDDPEDLKRMLRGSGVLEFRIVPTSEEATLSDVEVKRYVDRLAEMGPNKSGDNNYGWRKLRSPEDFKLTGAIFSEFADEKYVLASNKPDETLLHDSKSGWRLAKARVGNDDIGNYAVDFVMNETGAKLFLELTKNNINRHLCVLLDGQAISAPVIRSSIRKRGQISGGFNAVEARDLVDKLNAGSLPARLSSQPISVHSVSATIGADNLDAGLSAGVYGLIAVAVFMIAYYFVPGTLASLALAMNLLIILGVMALSRSTFTMPGIAGLILTIGMAVDANVLIFERIREEQQRGSSLRMAIKNGYGRAFRTIFDANLTTFITALVLWVLASEEVKGFALTLMIGIISSMFTALFVTRVVFDLLTSTGVLKKKLMMLQVIKKPNINWMSARVVFRIASMILIVGSWAVFLGRDEVKNSKYSIEFTGGTSAHVVLNDSGADMDRVAVEEAVRTVTDGGKTVIPNACVQQIGPVEDRKFEIVTTKTNILEARLTFGADSDKTAETITASIVEVANAMGDSRLANTVVEIGDGSGEFVIKTSQVNQGKVRRMLDKAHLADALTGPFVIREVVSDAIRMAMAGKLDVQDNLEPMSLRSEPITDELIAKIPDLMDYIGGVYLSFDFGSDKTDTLARLKERFEQLRFRGDFEQYGNNEFALFAPGNANIVETERITGVSIAVVPPDMLDSEEFKTFSANAAEWAQEALSLSGSLSRVTQIDSSIGAESMNDAMIATVVSLLAIVMYIWVRFGTMRFGVAAVVALVHDVSVAMGMVAASAWLAQTPVGKALLISDFKIDLPMIAAFLTVIGYSLNDTIVVFDRIRENRGKLATLSSDVVNTSINQTVSRTILTSFTTLIVLVVMYIWGGPGLRGFNYVMIIGVLVGTYSSIGIAAPLLYSAHAIDKRKK